MGVRPATMPGDGVGLRGRRKANTLLGLFKPGSEVRLTERKSVWGGSGWSRRVAKSESDSAKDLICPSG